MSYLSGCPTCTGDIYTELDALRAEVAALRKIVEAAADLALFTSNCGDNSCEYAAQKSGVGTNGGCCCIEARRVKFERTSRDGVGLGSFRLRLRKLRAALKEAADK